MPEIDHNRNIQRIIKVIKADTNLFDQGKTEGLLRKVEFGNPPNQKDSHFPMPYCYITTRDSIQPTSYPFGISIPSNVPQVSIQYEIKIVAKRPSKTDESEKQLYDLMKNMRNLVESNPTFIDPDADPIGPPIVPEDPIFTRSIINEVNWDRDTKGQLITVVSFVLFATVGVTSSVTLPNDPDDIILSLLSIPTNEEGEEWDADRIQNGDRVITGKGDFGNIFLEYETNETLDAQIRAKFDTEETITLTTNGVDRMINVYYADRNITSSFDAIPRAVLHLEIVKA